MPARLLPVLILLATLAFAASPFMVTNFAGFDPALFPVPQNDPPVQPAGWAFAIWGLLYLWLIVSAGYGVLRRADTPAWAPHRPWLLANMVLGVAWLPAAERSVLGATVLLGAMLVLSLPALFRTPRRDRWWLQAPLALYAGWLTAAFSASVGLVLAGWGLMAETPAALVALCFALVVGVTVQMRLARAPGYGLALIWALVAIATKNAAVPNLPVAALAGAGAAVVLLVVIMRTRRRPSAG